MPPMLPISRQVSNERILAVDQKIMRKINRHPIKPVTILIDHNNSKIAPLQMRSAFSQTSGDYLCGLFSHGIIGQFFARRAAIPKPTRSN
jgi:hypothetical protein